MSKQAVILLHGLGRTRFSFLRLQLALSSQYQTVNIGYPSRQHSIEALAKLAIEPALERCASASTIHFVTHSLGGILVREYLQHQSLPNLGYTVMLGPPNQGSELVDFFRRTPILNRAFTTINGPAGTQLGTQAIDKPAQLGPVDFPVGVIAGSKNRNPLYGQIMSNQHDGKHDGKVSVASSKVAGMKDHIVMPVDHTFMMQRRDVIDQIKCFLKQGEFNHHAV